MALLPAAAQEEQDLGQAFRDYLVEMPPIKRLIYSESAENVSFKGKPLEGILTYDLAVKGNTFFRRNLTNYPGHPKNYSHGGGIIGLTLTNQMYWYLRWSTPGGHVSAAPKEVPLKENINPASSMGPSTEFRVGGIRTLGLIAAVPGSIKWIDDKTFTMKRLPWEDNGWQIIEERPLKGHVISRDKHGRPTRIICREPDADISKDISKILSGQGGVYYEYGSREPRWFPTKIMVVAPLGFATYRQSKIIHSVDFSYFDPGPNGFTPSQFLKDQKLPPIVLVQSNGVNYILNDRGIQQVWVLPDKSGIRLRWMFLLAITVFLVAILLVWRNRRSRKL